MGCVSSLPVAIENYHKNAQQGSLQPINAVDGITDEMVKTQTKPDFDIKAGMTYLTTFPNCLFVVVSVQNKEQACLQDGALYVSSRVVVFWSKHELKSCSIHEFLPPEDSKSVQDVTNNLSRQPSRRITIERTPDKDSVHVVVSSLSATNGGTLKRHQSYSLGANSYWTIEDMRTNTVFPSLTRAIQHLFRTQTGTNIPAVSPIVSLASTVPPPLMVPESPEVSPTHTPTSLHSLKEPEPESVILNNFNDDED